MVYRFEGILNASCNKDYNVLSISSKNVLIAGGFYVYGSLWTVLKKIEIGKSTRIRVVNLHDP